MKITISHIGHKERVDITRESYTNRVELFGVFPIHKVLRGSHHHFIPPMVSLYQNKIKWDMKIVTKTQFRNLEKIHHILCIFIELVTALYICSLFDTQTFLAVVSAQGECFVRPSKDHPYNNTNNNAMLGPTTPTISHVKL